MPCDYGVDFGFEPEHVDRKSLYVSLEERIKYLHAFLEWTSEDVEHLTSGSKYLKQLIPAVVNLVYKKLLKFDITSRAFHTRTTASEEEPEDDYLTEETPQIQRRKMFLRWYLIKLCQDPTSMDFWRYLNKVGTPSPLNIEYIHLGACLGYIQDIFTEALMCHPQLSNRRKLGLIRAINKIIWIQNDLFAKWHLRDGEEYADEISIYSFDSGNKEGYLSGKRILGSSSESSIDDDQSSIASSVAPSTFSGAPSTHTTGSSRTPEGATKTSACPFADFARNNSSTETKIWH
ncbi:hypothetical protein N7513_010997 [Penicillium frequentans]|nr:hypothetical protein N7513_010997 [Penicillium glabrum]